MRSDRYLFVTGPDEFGQRHIVEEDDPRAVCVILPAGQFMPDDLAQKLGITQYLAGEEGMERRGFVGAASMSTEQQEGMAKKAVEMTNQVKAHGRSISMHTPAREEKAYVENAVGEPYILSTTERGEAGAMGAEQTGPTLQERAEAGGDIKAAEQKASEEMGGEQATAAAKAGEAQKSEGDKASSSQVGRQAELRRTRE